VTDFTPAIAIKGLRRPVFVVSCHDDRSRILCETWRDAVIVIHNSYLTSFMREIATFAMVLEAGAENAGWTGPTLPALYAAVGKKFVAEQMHAIAPSHLARILFLESVIDYERHFRRIYALRTADSRLARCSNLFARLVSDFFMHHELGHVAEVDSRFDPFIRPTIDEHLSELAEDEIQLLDVDLLRREARADIFALNCCFSIYGPDLTETTLRSYCTLLIDGVTALNVLYAAANELHRLNADSTHQLIDIDFEFALWHHRQAIMSRYVDGFIFDKRTIKCADNDAIGVVTLPAEALDVLLDPQGLVVPLSEDTRRISELLSFGFADTPHAFDAVINGSRVTSLLKDERGGQRAVSFTGLGSRSGPDQG
jgi:hypothetical protein